MTKRFRTLAVLVAAFAVALPAMAKDDALSLVPANAVTLGKVHLSSMRTSPLSSLLFQHIDRVSADGEAQKFLIDAGLKPLEDVDAVLVATSPRTSLGTDADILVVAEGRFQPDRLAAALVANGAVKKGAYIILDPNDEGETGAVAFVSPSLTIAGNERSVVNALAARANGGTRFAERGDLATGLALIDRGATAWALVDVARAARLANGGTIETGKGQQGEILRVALRDVSMVALWANDTGDALELGGKGLSEDAETLALLEDAIRGMLAALRIAVSEKEPDMVPVLRRFDVDRKANSISVEGSIPATMIRDLMAKKLASVK